MLQTVFRIRAVWMRLRLQMWCQWTTLRLRLRRCRLHVTVGHGIRYQSLPRVRLLGETGGSVRLAIGDHVDLGRMLLLDIDAGRNSSLTVGDRSFFEFAVRVQLLGGSITVGPGCEIRDGAVLKASSDSAVLVIGELGKIGRGASVHCHEAVRIADRVTLADRVTVVDSHHQVNGSDTWTMDQPLESGPVQIDRNAIVFTGAVITHGTVIGANSVIAANALVPKGNHAAGTVLVGNPARRVQRLEPGPSGD